MTGKQFDCEDADELFLGAGSLIRSCRKKMKPYWDGAVFDFLDLCVHTSSRDASPNLGGTRIGVSKPRVSFLPRSCYGVHNAASWTTS